MHFGEDVWMIKNHMVQYNYLHYNGTNMLSGLIDSINKQE